MRQISDEDMVKLTAYRKLPAPYPMVPVPTTYRLTTIPHDWHTIVRYDLSRSLKVNNLMSFES